MGSSDRNLNNLEVWSLYALIETAVEDSLISRVHKSPTACTGDDLGSKLVAKPYAKVS